MMATNWIKPYQAADILKVDIRGFNMLVELGSIVRMEQLAPGKFVFDEKECKDLRISMVLKRDVIRA